MAWFKFLALLDLCCEMGDGDAVTVSVEREEVPRADDHSGRYSDKGSNVVSEQAGNKRLRSSRASIIPVDSGIELKSLGLGSTSSDENRSLEEGCGHAVSSVTATPKQADSECLGEDSEVSFNISEDSAVESTSLLSQDHHQELSSLDHPLRSLSCIKMDEQDDAFSTVGIPEVKISNPTKKGVRSEYIPFRNLFRPEEGAAERHWAESIGYKNWLLHLARQRRCEILILIGFLMWLVFFIALAIALNGNGQLVDEENGSSNFAGSVNNSSSDQSKAVGTVSVDSSRTEESTTIHQTNFMTEATNQHTVVNKPEKSSDVASTRTQFDALIETSKTLLSTVPPLTDTVHNHDSTSDISMLQSNSDSVMTTAATQSMAMYSSDDAANFAIMSTVEENPTIESVTTKSNVATSHGEADDETTAMDKTMSQSYTTSPTSTKNDTGVLPVSTRKMQNFTDMVEPPLFVNNADENVTPMLPYSELSQSDIIESTTQVLTQLSGLSKMADEDTNTSNYLIGVGRADITGPAADVNMMGYANPKQVSGGIHLRQYSRAFVVEDPKTSVRSVFVNIDACMASTLVKLEVMKALKTEFGDVYRAENLCISGTHTHSGPAGFLQDVLFQITSWGYVEETLTAMVTGIVDSIKAAHDSMQPGYILLNKGHLVGSNINRSPTAYENNPVEERSRYKHNVDTEMVLLKFMDQSNNGIGMINWFPVHCTSMNNTNNLISSDNKGYAEILFESFMDPNAHPGQSNFVAAFAQSNEGDVSPNTRGPHCTDTGAPCDNIHSTCDGKSQFCVASGPGGDMFESTKIIGRNQFEKAKQLYLSATTTLSGPVRFIHEYVNMTSYEVILQNRTKVKTCKPAMGYSFAAGTTDGPGAFDFKQGEKSGNKFWDLITNFLHAPSEEQTNCHHPKPILLDTGEMESPYEWQPQIVETQILQIGQFLIAALPGEFTTMAGRRLRDGVVDIFKSRQPNINYEVALAGLSNSYSDYITTHEEYLAQRYEGASTIYGPYTSEAYTQQFKRLSRYLAQNKNVTSEVRPVDIKDKLISLQIGVIYDGTPIFKSFGYVSSDVKNSYNAGDEVTVTFVAGNPRNCLTQVGVKNMTFLTVEKETNDGSWEIVFTDADWDTKFTWVRTSTFRALSDAIISWQTHKDTPHGKYRIRHNGYSKSIISGISPYSGTSSVFVIKSS